MVRAAGLCLALLSRSSRRAQRALNTEHADGRAAPRPQLAAQPVAPVHAPLNGHCANGCGGNGAGNGVSAASPQRKRVLILLSDTGGGHRASAEALAAAFEAQYGALARARRGVRARCARC